MSEIIAAYREFGGLGLPEFVRQPEGQTIEQMRSRMRTLPRDFSERGVVLLNGHEVPRAVWGLVRPKAPAPGRRVEISFHVVPHGGGDDGGKQVFALVATIALAAATGFILSGGLQTAGGLFAAKSTSAYLLATGVSLGASLLLSALVPPPTIEPTEPSRRIRNLGSASAEGNVLDPNGPIPRVVGTRKIFPPLAAEPLIYFDGPDEVVDAAYVLAGPHEITDIRIGGTEISAFTDVESETREGWPGSLDLNIVRRQSWTEALQNELRGHVVADSDGRTIESFSGSGVSGLPQPAVVVTRDAPDEMWISLTFTGGLHKNASETNYLRVPFRIRIREIGDPTWINLPELHFQAANVRQLRATVKLIWTDDATTSPSAAVGEGWVEARILNPDQTVSPATAGYAADSYFDDGAGDDYLESGNLGSTAVDHVIMDRYTTSLYLDTATFPRGRYEVEIERGAQFLSADYDADLYEIDSVVYDPFEVAGSPGKIPQSKDGVSDTVYILRASSIWNENPLPTRDLAVVAVRARNRQLERMSCVASGYVPDWDGTAWRDWKTTSNPAPHFVSVLTGQQNFDPMPLSLLDDTTLTEWRTACTTNGYECNGILEDESVDSALRVIAGCGYARPYMSEILGIAMDYDRSAEDPVQIFTPRNSAGFGYDMAFTDPPAGLRVDYQDKDRDYDRNQIQVFLDGALVDSPKIEQISYEGLVTESENTARALYDQRQAVYRNVFYRLDAPAESVVCRKGSLVGVQHDMLNSHAFYGRVESFTTDGGGDVDSITLDAEVEVFVGIDLLAETDIFAIPDLLAPGSSGVAIRRGGTTTVHPVSNSAEATKTLTFSPSISPTNIEEDTLVTVGEIGQEYLRLIVFNIEPQEGLSARMTLVDEAPELWS